jgi:hypothetical protein
MRRRIVVLDGTVHPGADGHRQRHHEGAATMRMTRIKLVAGGAVALFGLGVFASGCSPVPVSTSPSAMTGGRTGSSAMTAATASAAPRPTGSVEMHHSGKTGVVIPDASPSKTKPVARKAPAHIVILTDSPGGSTPYLTSLQRDGAAFAGAQPVSRVAAANDLALFSGATHGLTGDLCPRMLSGANLAMQLAAAGKTFAGYAEAMPSDGFTGCANGSLYTRAHSPWASFRTVPATSNLRLSRFPKNFDRLPTVSWVVPSPTADGTWLQRHLSAYAMWARTHNSLFIVAADGAPLLFYGEHVKPGAYAKRTSTYAVLRTIEALYRLPCLGAACDATPITTIWGGP